MTTGSQGGAPARIVLATFGSLGDLHPYIAIAMELKSRGHDPTIATSELYRERVEAEGIGFAPIRPDLSDVGDESDLMPRIMDRRRGPEFVLRRLVMPFLRPMYDDLAVTARDADLLVGHPLTFALPLVAEKLRIPWVSVALSPISIFSAYDPSAPPAAPGLVRLRALGPGLGGLLIRFVQWTMRSWAEPIQRLRRELGLPPSARNPLFAGQFSPHMTLALFSRALAAPQPDWPLNTRQPGFAFYDRGAGAAGLSGELTGFLDSGPAPIVFTLGSSAVMNAGRFYEESARAANLLGRRAVLLIGRDARNRPSGALPDSIHVAEYAPYSQLLPRGAATVHQGGVGTTGQAMRSGRPMLVMPYSMDQPDNAIRAARLGVALLVDPRRYSAARAAGHLEVLFSDPKYSRRAEEIAQTVRKEAGARGAADAIEELLASRQRPV